MLIEIQRQIELKNKDSQEQNEKIKALPKTPKPQKIEKINLFVFFYKNQWLIF